MSQNPAPVFEELALPESDGSHVWLHRPRSLGGAFHCHAELEVNLVTGGHATYLVDSQRVRLARRDVLWLFPSQNHVLIEQSHDFSMWIVVWQPQFLQLHCCTPDWQMLLQHDPQKILHRRLGEQQNNEIEVLCERVRQYQGDLQRAGLGYLLFCFWQAFFAGEQNALGGAVHPAVERAARLLRDLNPPPSVPILARQVGLSPSRLSRLFATQTGCSLTDFRAAQCLQRALRLCSETELSLSDIAARAGFGSYAQFHRTFRAQVGRSPAQHRRG